MKKVHIDRDEWYPVYDIYVPTWNMPEDKLIEISDELLESYQKNFREFMRIQEILRELAGDKE